MVEKDVNKIGNVIRIIDDRTLIVNVGNDVLTVGDKVKVYDSLDVLHDLDGTELCVFEHTKDVLEVIEVNEKYSICQKKETRVSQNIALAVSPLLEMEKTTYVPLNIDGNDIQPLRPDDPMIRIGDPIKMA